jgi:6,7-dimethyl-8-ribityllumazine synthase
MPEQDTRILVVEARFYPELADELLKGAIGQIEAAHAFHDVVTVAGALEIPTAIALAAEAGHRSIGVAYDGYVALGTVIRGETYHFEIVASESARGLMELGVERRLPIGNGILTVEDEAQAWARAKVDQGDKGGAAARACLDMITIRRRLLGQKR